MTNTEIVFNIIKKSSKNLTAYEILDKLQKIKKTQPMTVYRALDKLIEEERIHKNSIKKTFVLCNHDHVDDHNTALAICKKCGDTEELKSNVFTEFLHFIEDIIEGNDIYRVFVFGFIHTLIPLIGFYSGWSINRFLKIVSNGAIAGIVGIVIAHIIADFIAALADPSLKSAAIGIVLGGFLPLIAVPFLEIYVTKSKYHTVVGDHEDLEKDLKTKHK